jgi:hypothetical protein
MIIEAAIGAVVVLVVLRSVRASGWGRRPIAEENSCSSDLVPDSKPTVPTCRAKAILYGVLADGSGAEGDRADGC